MSTPTIQDVPLADLKAEYLRQQAAESAARKNRDAIIIEVNRRLASRLYTALIIDKGKEAGEGTDEIDGVRFHVYVGKKVTWDTEKLKTVYASQPQDVSEKIFKVAITVPEKVFSAITDPKLNEALVDARTVEIGAPYVSFAPEPKS
jgi:hypothetical protein